jgi:hypothetical protein
LQDGIAKEMDSSEANFLVTVNGDNYVLEDQVNAGFSMDLTLQDSKFVGTMNEEGYISELIMELHPNADITLIDETSIFDSQGNLIQEDEIKDLEWIARMNFGDEGALKAIVHTLGMEIYKIAKRDNDLKAIRISLYYRDLIDEYGNDIPWKEAYDNTFVIDDLDEVRRYRDGLGYAIENEVSLAYFVITGEYSYLWRN